MDELSSLVASLTELERANQCRGGLPDKATEVRLASLADRIAQVSGVGLARGVGVHPSNSRLNKVGLTWEGALGALDDLAYGKSRHSNQFRSMPTLIQQGSGSGAHSGDSRQPDEPIHANKRRSDFIGKRIKPTLQLTPSKALYRQAMSSSIAKTPSPRSTVYLRPPPTGTGKLDDNPRTRLALPFGRVLSPRGSGHRGKEDHSSSSTPSGVSPALTIPNSKTPAPAVPWRTQASISDTHDSQTHTQTHTHTSTQSHPHRQQRGRSSGHSEGVSAAAAAGPERQGHAMTYIPGEDRPLSLVSTPHNSPPPHGYQRMTGAAHGIGGTSRSLDMTELLPAGTPTSGGSPRDTAIQTNHRVYQITALQRELDDVGNSPDALRQIAQRAVLMADQQAGQAVSVRGHVASLENELAIHEARQASHHTAGQDQDPDRSKGHAQIIALQAELGREKSARLTAEELAVSLMTRVAALEMEAAEVALLRADKDRLMTRSDRLAAQLTELRNAMHGTAADVYDVPGHHDSGHHEQSHHGKGVQPFGSLLQSTIASQPEPGAAAIRMFGARPPSPLSLEPAPQMRLQQGR